MFLRLVRAIFLLPGHYGAPRVGWDSGRLIPISPGTCWYPRDMCLPQDRNRDRDRDRERERRGGREREAETAWAMRVVHRPGEIWKPV